MNDDAYDDAYDDANDETLPYKYKNRYDIQKIRIHKESQEETDYILLFIADEEVILQQITLTPLELQPSVSIG